MASKPNYIELNGKRYDAYSGELLGSAPAKRAVASKTTTKSPQSASQPVKSAAKAAHVIHLGHSIDGFTGRSAKKVPAKPVLSSPTAAKASVALVASPQLPVAQPVKLPSATISDFVHPMAHQVHHRGPSKGSTLMRSAVKKPETSLKRQIKVQNPTSILVKQPSITVTPKLSSYSINPSRAAHAKEVPRSPHVSRYSIDHRSLASAEHKVIEANVSAQPQAATAQAAIRPVYAAASTDVMRSPAVPQAPSMDVFERALARANDHQEQPHQRKAKRRKAPFDRRALNIAAASLLMLLIVTFFGWQNKTNLTMHYAASKAGVAATMPGFQPAGFHAGQLSYGTGKVTLDFKNDSGQSFDLVQASTTWDSQTLRDSFVAEKSRTFETIQAAGRTIYSYGDNNATWVDHGVWYQIISHGNLSTTQLVKLAVSM